MKAVYSLVQTEIDSSKLGDINQFLKTAHDQIHEYNSGGGPANLHTAESEGKPIKRSEGVSIFWKVILQVDSCYLLIQS